MREVAAMILSDNETKVDMLNNHAIAKSVVNLIVECDNRPISIGIHGDWGAGKSSILAMIEDDFKGQDGFECIRFNGWKHQGFEDAKIALMSSILSELTEKKNFGDEVKGIIKKLWKNINWISAAKAVGSVAVSLSTGIPPIGLLTNFLDTVKSGAADPDKVTKAIDSVGQYLTEAKVFEDTSLAKEFSEFQKSFDELLKASRIKKLVVLVDDLDRCLPNVTIETMEAIRLFMFSNSTAFVIAADEAMIKYAVTNHFPNLPGDKDNSTTLAYSDKYLEKLIQVPFHIPALGEVESGMYITLLLIGSILKEDDDDFIKLLEISVDKMKRPWENHGLSIGEIRETLKPEKYEEATAVISVANQISTILAKNTQGNPRKIKRFINMLLLRQRIAEARGFGEYIHLPELSKLMLAEYYFEKEYIKIAAQTDDYGICELLDKLEEAIHNQPNSEVAVAEKEDKKVAFAVPREGVLAQDDVQNKDLDEWLKNIDFVAWASIEPQLGRTNLLPYFFASKKQKDYFFDEVKSQKLRTVIDILMRESMVIAGSKETIDSLNMEEAQKVFEVLKGRVQSQNTQTMPRGIEGIRVLVAGHLDLEDSLLSLIESFDPKSVGGWICSGWNSTIKTDGAKARWNNYCDKLSAEGTVLVKAAAGQSKL